MTLLSGRELERAVSSVQLIVFDFDGVFTDNTVYVSQEGVESVRCWRGDGLGLRKLEKLGIQAVIVSTEMNPVVSVRAAKLRIRCEQAVEDKRALVEAIAADLGLTLEQVAFVGNDINDVPCMRTVGLPIAVADAHPDVDDCVRYRTTTPGGRGAVREICDLFERIRAA
jgi:YrbI family 3-deoxy-D-manno-octulosonate 8-phosphate phosphatase